MSDTPGATAAPSTGAPSASSAPATPSETSTTPATPEAPGTSASDGSIGGDADFSLIFDGIEAAPPAETPTPPAPTTAPVAPTPTPAPVEGQPVVPPVAPVATPTPPGPAAPSPPGTPAPASAGPVLDPTDPLGLATALQGNESEVVRHVASTLFRLSDEDSRALEENPIEVIPRLLAGVYVQAQKAMLTHMGKMIPQMIQRQTTATQRNRENEDKFYARWPSLNREAHGSLVQQYATLYRQMNPNVTLDQLVEKLGPAVMMAANVAPVAAAPGQSGRVVTPNPMAIATGSAPAAAPAFVPAGGGTPSLQQIPEPGAFDWLDSSKHE